MTKGAREVCYINNLWNSISHAGMLQMRLMPIQSSTAVLTNIVSFIYIGSMQYTTMITSLI
ncbi:hypothetical protein SLEP1_g60340, partial [Rubroshorea leprosula]